MYYYKLTYKGDSPNECPVRFIPEHEIDLLKFNNSGDAPYIRTKDGNSYNTRNYKVEILSLEEAHSAIIRFIEHSTLNSDW